MQFVYLILARKGSVRIKNKNLKKIENKSLVERSIDFAKKIAKVDQIILSTDSNQIRSIGRKKGLNIDHLRPKRLSTNFSIMNVKKPHQTIVNRTPIICINTWLPILLSNPIPP